MIIRVRAIWFLVLLALALPMATALAPETAIAEERIQVAQSNSGDRRTLFDILFGRKKEESAPQPKRTAPKRSSPSCGCTG